MKKWDGAALHSPTSQALATDSVVGYQEGIHHNSKTIGAQSRAKVLHKQDELCDIYLLLQPDYINLIS